MAKEWHLGTLALIPDHFSHLLVVLRRCWYAAGPFAMRHVSSAYCNLVVGCESIVRSVCCLRVSTSVLMTVLNATTEKGSPWYTPIWRGMAGVDHLVVMILADTPL